MLFWEYILTLAICFFVFFLFICSLQTNMPGLMDFEVSMFYCKCIKYNPNAEYNTNTILFNNCHDICTLLQIFS